MANTTSRQSRKKRRTHDRIFAAAGRIARKNGLAAASVSRLALARAMRGHPAATRCCPPAANGPPSTAGWLAEKAIG